MKHPLPRGTHVKVAKRRLLFKIVKPLYQGDKLLGYRCEAPSGRYEAIRLDAIQKEVRVR